MRRKRTVRNLPSDSSEDDEPLSNLTNSKRKEQQKKKDDDDSSSESDIENYLQAPDKLDFDSPFFNLQKDNPPSFDKIESDILAGVSQLTDSESENEAAAASTGQPEGEAVPSTSKLNFGQLHEYTRRMEEAKKQVEEYNKKRQEKQKEMNIENLLAAGEAKQTGEVSQGTFNSSDFESCSDSEKEGWEEVKEEQKAKNEIPQEGLEITVDLPGVVKKKSKEVDVLASIKRRINRVRKENQVLVHKVHLLCWIAHGNFVSSKINSENVLAVALSLLPSENCYPPNRTDLNYLEQVVKWFRNTVTNVDKKVPENKSLEQLLEAQITKKEAYNKKMLVLIFIAIMRSLGIQCRLVLSFQVEPLRPPNSELLSLSTKTEIKEGKDKTTTNGDGKTKEVKTRSKSTSDLKGAPKPVKTKENEETKARSKSTSGKEVVKKVKTDTKAENKSKPKSKNPKEKIENVKNETKDMNKSRSKSASEKEKVKRVSNEEKKTRPKSTSTASRTKSDDKLKQSKTTAENPRRSRRNQKELTIPQLDGATDTKTPPKPNLKNLKQKQPPCSIRNHPKRLKNISKYRDSDSEDDFSTTRSPFANKSNDSPKTNAVNLKKLKTQVQKSDVPAKTNGANLKKLKESLDVRNDIVNIVKKSIKEQKDLNKSKTARKRKSTLGSEDDSDYVPEVVKKKHHDSDDDFGPKVKVKKRVQVKPGEDEKVKKKHGMDVWAEVFLETEEKWISVDLIKGQVHCVNELYTRASHPISYIVAWNNNNTLKDITRRYCTNFNTVTRKLRIDASWWEQSLKPFTGSKSTRDKEEDDELERQQMEKPLPTSISEYKNHPLYVLKRHLLKFEALYPPDPPSLGFVRNEPVYSRQCVYTLHSRDIWLKHAKVVKPGEQPYKIVKARPKWDKLSNSVITDQLLEIFGPWQTMDYEPPTAENGIVPRNAFGNVELFKACMIPKKCVHLKLPGLNKVAKRMNIDCAPALTGFDFHGGWNHPTYDGYIVCEEFVDELVMAWELEQEEIEKREQEKLDKRVYGNWKKLIRGLLIRERLKIKYEFGETSEGLGKKKAKGPKLVTKKRRIESDNDSD